MTGRKRADVLEDVLWLAEAGVSAQQWPARLGMTADAVARALYRVGRRDLANPVQAMARREYVNQPRDEPCPQCGGTVLKYRTYCSRRCAGFAINRRIRAAQAGGGEESHPATTAIGKRTPSGSDAREIDSPPPHHQKRRAA